MKIVAEAGQLSLRLLLCHHSFGTVTALTLIIWCCSTLRVMLLLIISAISPREFLSLSSHSGQYLAAATFAKASLEDMILRVLPFLQMLIIRRPRTLILLSCGRCLIRELTEVRHAILRALVCEVHVALRIGKFVT